jgi:hypothetical protein
MSTSKGDLSFDHSMNSKSRFARRWSSLEESWRFAIIAFVMARLFYGIWSWVILTIQPVAIQNFALSGEPILSVFSVHINQGFVYLREVKGDVLTFQSVDLEHIRDQQTGTIWEISSGKAIEGPYQGEKLMPAKTHPSDIFPYFNATVYPGGLLSMWQRFDANWYVSIAEHGYGSIPGDDHFPPFFPLLIRIFQQIFGSAFLAGIFVSQIGILISLKLLYDLFLGWGEATIGSRAFSFFVLFPTFFFFFSAYSESIFLVTTLLAFRGMQNRRWAWAGFWVFCAILTRLQGAALLVPMLYLMWKDAPLLRKPAHWIGLSIAGLGGLFYLYLRSLQVTSGAVPFVEPEWHARLVMPWETYWYALQTIFMGNATFVDILNWSLMTLFLILLIWGWKKIPLEYNLYTAFSLLTILVRIVETQPLISFSRYALTLFPAFFVLSLVGENPWLRRAILYLSILLSLYLSGQFFIWGWVA